MIPKSRKFPLRTEFFSFRAQAQKIPTPSFLFYYLPSPQSSRLAVIIPKKVNKLATTRNYLKRLTYNTLWPLIKEKNLDLVVVYKPLPLKKSVATTQQLLSELNSTISNITKY